MLMGNQITTNPYAIAFSDDDLIALRRFFKIHKEWMATNNLTLPSVIEVFINMYDQYALANHFHSDTYYLFRLALQEEYIKRKQKKDNVYHKSDLMQYVSNEGTIVNSYMLITWINIVETLYNKNFMKR